MRESRMTIEDKAFKQSGCKYSAICKINSSEGNDFLAALEDPTHSQLDVRYLRKTKDKKSWYAKKLRELRKAIKTRISELDAEIQDFQEIPKLSEHLHLPSTDSVDRAWPSYTSANEEESLNPNERETYVSKLINKFIRQVASSNSSETTKSVTRKKVASTLGDTSGNPGGANKQNSIKNNNNRGSGSSLGTSKEDSEGESTTIISDKSIFMTRKELTQKLFK